MSTHSSFTWQFFSIIHDNSFIRCGQWCCTLTASWLVDIRIVMINLQLVILFDNVFLIIAAWATAAYISIVTQRWWRWTAVWLNTMSVSWTWSQQFPNCLLVVFWRVGIMKGESKCQQKNLYLKNIMTTKKNDKQISYLDVVNLVNTRDSSRPKQRCIHPSHHCQTCLHDRPVSRMFVVYAICRKDKKWWEITILWKFYWRIEFFCLSFYDTKKKFKIK